MNKISTTIENTINKHFNKVIYSLSIIAIVAFWTLASLMFTGCDKVNDPQPQAKEITVQVTTEGLHINEMKSFDVNTWQYNYNPNSYELKFVGSKGNVYTFQKTITELKAGFSVSLMPDPQYTITYTSIHSANGNSMPLDNVLDIVINETKAITTPTDLTLQAKPDDFLVIMDNGCLTASFWYTLTNNNLAFFNSPDNTFKYMYYNVEGNITINYRDANNDPQSKIITNALKGNVYHIVSSVNGNIGINILGMNYNLLGW